MHVCLSLSLCLSVCLSAGLSLSSLRIYLSPITSSSYISVGLYACLSVFVCLSVCLSVCRSLSLSLYASISLTFNIFFSFLSLSISVYKFTISILPNGTNSFCLFWFDLFRSFLLFLSVSHLYFCFSLANTLCRSAWSCLGKAMGAASKSQVRSLFIPSVVMFSRLSSYLSVSS